jgi:hypothetical protein
VTACDAKQATRSHDTRTQADKREEGSGNALPLLARVGCPLCPERESPDRPWCVAGLFACTARLKLGSGRQASVEPVLLTRRALHYLAR